MTDLVLSHQSADGVATVTLNDPGKLNALSPAMLDAVIGTFERLSSSPALRAVVLTGAGGKAFVGGADIRTMAGLDPTSGRAFITRLHQACDAVRQCPVPVIARIDGHALGGGLELAASCDLRVASTRSFFAMPEVRLGIPSVIETVLLPGLIGWGRTRLLVYTGRVVDAATALAWGLIEDLAEPESLDAAVERCTDEILLASDDAIRKQKSLLRAFERMSLDEGIAHSVQVFGQSWESPEPGRRMREHLETRAKAKAQRR